MEEWRAIPSLPGYEASSLGRVQSVDHWTIAINGKRRFFPGRVRRPTPGSNGRLRVTVVKKGRRATLCTYSLVLEAFHGPRPSPAMVARHLDGDIGNCCSSNLRWGTPLENSADMIRHGHSARGERNRSCKLTVEDVRRMRRLLSRGALLREAAAQFGVSGGTVSSIKSGRTWGWLD